jgi:hypothetical protein
MTGPCQPHQTLADSGLTDIAQTAVEHYRVLGGELQIRLRNYRQIHVDDHDVCWHIRLGSEEIGDPVASIAPGVYQPVDYIASWIATSLVLVKKDNNVNHDCLPLGPELSTRLRTAPKTNA